jgi:lysozyme
MAVSKKSAGAVCSVGAIIALVLSMNLGVRTNKEGLELIGNAEACRREPYMCPAGVLTDGIGNTHGVKPGASKTDEQVAEDWAANILDAERCINENFRGPEMNDNQFSAMTSAAFNMGCRGLMTYVNGNGKRVPTTIWRHAAAARWPEMCERLPDFTRSGGKVLPGLVTRRAKERKLCFKPVEG